MPRNVLCDSENIVSRGVLIVYRDLAAPSNRAWKYQEELASRTLSDVTDRIAKFSAAGSQGTLCAHDDVILTWTHLSFALINCTAAFGAGGLHVQ